MGLDQYLEVRQYISRRDWTDEGSTENPDFHIIAPMTRGGVLDPNGFSGISLTYNAAQWRKANGIQRWMQDHLANGDMQNCQDYYVSTDTLVELRQSCELVLEAKDKKAMAASEGLTPMEGFFYGGQDMDEWYFRDLQYTVDTINRLEKSGALSDTEISFYYRAWW